MNRSKCWGKLHDSDDTWIARSGYSSFLHECWEQPPSPGPVAQCAFHRPCPHKPKQSRDLLCSILLMFVPSLSWQNDRFFPTPEIWKAKEARQC